MFSIGGSEAQGTTCTHIKRGSCDVGPDAAECGNSGCANLQACNTCCENGFPGNENVGQRNACFNNCEVMHE